MTDRAIVMAAGHANHAQAIAWNKIGRRAIMIDPLAPRPLLRFARRPAETRPRHRADDRPRDLHQRGRDGPQIRALVAGRRQAELHLRRRLLGRELPHLPGQHFPPALRRQFLSLHHARHRLLRLLREDRRRSHRGLRRRPARASASSPTAPTGSTRPSASRPWPSPPAPPAATPCITKSTPPSATTPSSSRRSRRRS